VDPVAAGADPAAEAWAADQAAVEVDPVAAGLAVDPWAAEAGEADQHLEAGPEEVAAALAAVWADPVVVEVAPAGVDQEAAVPAVQEAAPADAVVVKAAADLEDPEADTPWEAEDLVPNLAQ
jgi:hypothetical protein